MSTETESDWRAGYGRLTWVTILFASSVGRSVTAIIGMVLTIIPELSIPLGPGSIPAVFPSSRRISRSKAQCYLIRVFSKSDCFKLDS
jgi:hypothetical protein